MLLLLLLLLSHYLIGIENALCFPGTVCLHCQLGIQVPLPFLLLFESTVDCVWVHLNINIFSWGVLLEYDSILF